MEGLAHSVPRSRVARGRGKALQHGVAYSVAKLVIDLLNPVEIEQQHGERLAIDFLLRQKAGGAVEEGAAIGDAAQRIDERIDLMAELGALLGHVELQEGHDALGGDVLFARIGGEEFASCLPVGDMDEAYAIADRVRRNFVTAAAKFGTAELTPSVSVGVTLGYDPHTAVTDLLAIVDRALYRAKELGRNRVETEVPSDGEVKVGAPSIVPIIGPDRSFVPQSVGRRWRAAS